MWEEARDLDEDSHRALALQDVHTEGFEARSLEDHSRLEVTGRAIIGMEKWTEGFSP